MVFSFKMIGNHTYFNGFHGFFIQNDWKPYIFQWFSWFLKPWKLLGGGSLLWLQNQCAPQPKSVQSFKNHENHWNMCGFQSFWIKKPWKPLKYVWFSIIFNEKTMKTIEICVVFQSCRSYKVGKTFAPHRIPQVPPTAPRYPQLPHPQLQSCTLVYVLFVAGTRLGHSFGMWQFTFRLLQLPDLVSVFECRVENH